MAFEKATSKGSEGFLKLGGEETKSTIGPDPGTWQLQVSTAGAF